MALTRDVSYYFCGTLLLGHCIHCRDEGFVQCEVEQALTLSRYQLPL